MKSDFYWLHFAKRKGVYDSFLSDWKNLLKAYFFALKGRFFADELGIIKIMALGAFEESTVKAVGTVADAWDEEVWLLGEPTVKAFGIGADAWGDRGGMQFGCLGECIYRTYV